MEAFHGPSDRDDPLIFMQRSGGPKRHQSYRQADRGYEKGGDRGLAGKPADERTGRDRPAVPLV